MRTIVLACAATLCLAGCASPCHGPPPAGQGLYAPPSDAAFMGYHGPLWCENRPWD